MAPYLLPIADRVALHWIVTTQQTAFGDHRRADAARLRCGDTLVLYTTRGCFRNPTRDRGRLIGLASVTEELQLLDPPAVFRDRAYPNRIGLKITDLAPLRQGAELAPLVAELDLFRGAGDAWSIRLRRALIPLTEHDAATLRGAVMEVSMPFETSVDSYEEVKPP